MGIRRPSLGDNPEQVVGRVLDSAYDDVKKVADNLPEILTVNDNTATALQAVTDVQAAEANVQVHETNTAASAAAALASEQAAAASEAAAGTSETNTAVSETNAAASATSASGSASAAATSETNAAGSATAAANSAAATATSETNAGASETNAAGSAAAAATSEANADASEAMALEWAEKGEDLVVTGNPGKYSAKHHAAKAQASASAAATSQGAASTSETNAATSAGNAATSETNAAGSASAASTSATTAANSATAASVSETNAAASEVNASGSASSAASDLAAIQGIFDNFDDRFLGTFAVAPTTDNDGQPLSVGAVYYHDDGVTKEVRFWNGGSWEAPASSAQTSATNAANSEAAAAASASNAATSEFNAVTSETNAAGSASAAASSETNAADYLAQFQGEYTAADVLAKLLTVDGAGSGLDADLFQGKTPAAFLASSGPRITDGYLEIEPYNNSSYDDGSRIQSYYAGYNNDGVTPVREWRLNARDVTNVLVPLTITVNGYRVLTTADEGVLDAGTLDGLDSGQFVRADASDTLTGAAYTYDNTGANAIPLRLKTAAGEYSRMAWYSGGVARWAIGKDAEAETGGDVGSNLEILSYNDAGSGQVIAQFRRSNGDLDLLQGGLTVAGGVGFGTSSPLRKVHVAAGSPLVRFSDTDAVTDQDVMAFMEFYRGENTNRVGWFGYGGTGNPDITVANEIADGAVKIVTNSTEQVRVDNTGNVGIRTTTPKELLNVQARDNVPTTYPIRVDNNADNYGAGYGAYGMSNRVNALNQGIDYTIDIGGDLIVKTQDAERLRIADNGYVIVGALDDTMWNNTAASEDGVVLRPDGRIEAAAHGADAMRLNRTTSDGSIAYFYREGSVVGSISITASATAYNTNSDYRLKENVVGLIGAADRLAQIPVHRFNFKAEPEKTVDGFLAHEVQAVIPEAVTGTKDEVDEDGNPVYQAIDQSKLVPLLTAALQEAITRIEALEAQHAA